MATTKGATKFPGIPNPPGVSLIDRFWSSIVAVKKPTRLCVPTQKNAEPPPAAPEEHLEAYQVKPAQKFTKVLGQVVSDQFGTLHLDVLKPAELMVPTAKSLVSSPSELVDASTDHFQCYKVKDLKIPVKFQPVTVTLLDQFQGLEVLVKKPSRLCAPVDKNGEDPTAPGHPDHLMCYQVKDLKLPTFARVNSVFVNNQFGPETLDVKKPAELCVPAIDALAPTPTPTATPSAFCCDFGGGLCGHAPTSTEQDCLDIGGTIGAAGEVCNAATGDCEPPPPSPGSCCAFGSCAAGPDMNAGFCSSVFGGTFSPSASCNPDGTCAP